MKEPVEKMLSSRIRQVFEEFEDPSADAGWDELRKKYSLRNRRPVIVWLSSTAAILILATSTWLVDQSEKTTAIKPAKAKEELVKSKNISQLNEGNAGNAITPGNKTVLSKRKGTAYIQNTEKLNPPLLLPEEHKGELSRLESTAQLPPPEQEALLKAGVGAEIQKSKTASLVLDHQNGFTLTPIDPVEKPLDMKVFTLPHEAGTTNKNSDQKTKKVALSVFAGSYVNYSEGSENQMNFGAGFVSDIRLNKNLKLSTGLSIASNSLNYDNGQNLPARAYLSFDASKSSSSGNLTTITSYNASLLALDIPLNIKYQFVPESDRFYVMAGFSSGTYLNETYAYHYRNFNTASGNYVSQTQDQKIKKQLNNFDLGQTLNLSLGLSSSFWKTQTISIEPFLKYPLGGLGSENLKFGSAGVNLKLRFAPLKK